MNSPMRSVLVVDDDAHIREVIAFALRRAGFEVATANDGVAALRRIEQEAPELVILDILMPELDGLEVCRAVRAGPPHRRHMPILFLSSKDDEVDRIVGLEIGADDYIGKPFSPRELVARVKAQFRRLDKLAEEVEEAIVVGPLTIDPSTHTVALAGRAIELTRTEFGLLLTLARDPGRVLGRDALMNGAYSGHRVVSDRTIDSHMRRLRSKLRHCGLDPIQTVHGVGFRLVLAS